MPGRYAAKGRAVPGKGHDNEQVGNSMYETVEANWLLFLIAFLIAVAIAWYVFNVRRKTRVTADRRDVLDEGADRAKRNQAFLDAPARPVGETAIPPRQADEAPARPAASPLEPRATASIPLPGAIIGAETAVNAAAGTPETIGRAEQEEAEGFRRGDADAAGEESGAGEPGPAIPPAAIADAAPAGPATVIPIVPVTEPPADELTRLKGIGSKLAVRLNELGIARIEQIAAWDEADIDRIDAQLGRFQGRVRRDDWVEQARLLSAGDRAGYEEKFGRL